MNFDSLLGERTERREHWQFVNHLGYLGSGNHPTLKRRVSHRNAANEFPIARLQRWHSNRRAAPHEKIEDSRPRRIQSHVVEQQGRTRQNERRGNQKNSCRKIAWYGQLARRESRPRMNPNDTAAAFEL